MPELSTIFAIWLPILLAGWVSFVKNSVQAAVCLALIILLTQQFELLLIVGFLLGTSLLIPKPNPRYQKRRFQFGKAFYIFLIGYSTWTFSALISKPTPVAFEAQNLDFLIILIAPALLIAWVVILLFTREHVR